MAYHEIFYKNEDNDPLPAVFDDRDKVLAAIEKRKVCDVLVVGGGIQGACFAQIAAFNGLDVILFEQADYAQATSSNSSKLIHGGLRYLELLDFKQVFEGLRARADLFVSAKHIVKPKRFLIPVRKNDWRTRVKFKIGLLIYDLLISDRQLKHRWHEDLSNTNLASQASNLSGAYSYTDGLTEDSRLVLEHIIAARQEGARCLNYSKVSALAQGQDGIMQVGWRDCIAGTTHQLKAGIVINCTGPWVAELGRVKPGPLKDKVLYSRGSHIIFDKEWQGDCLFMPRAEKSRYYFVLPHAAGTLVGTTERVVANAQLNVAPDKSEINELLELVKNDLPSLGLDIKSACYSFAGIRTLPLKNTGTDISSAKISRRHIWHYSAGVLSLIGGKYTSARSTAFEGLKKVFKLGFVQNKPQPLYLRVLPGASLLEESEIEFRLLASQAGVAEQIIDQTMQRRGSLVRYFKYCDDPFRVLGNVVLAGDVELSIRLEQACTISDLMRRRLLLEYQAGHGLSALDEIAEILKKYYPESDLEAQKNSYIQRVAELNPQNIMK